MKTEKSHNFNYISHRLLILIVGFNNIVGQEVADMETNSASKF